MYDTQFKNENGFVLATTHLYLDSAIAEIIDVFVSESIGRHLRWRVVGPKRDEDGNVNEDAVLFLFRRHPIHGYVIIEQPEAD